MFIFIEIIVFYLEILIKLIVMRIFYIKNLYYVFYIFDVNVYLVKYVLR